MVRAVESNLEMIRHVAKRLELGVDVVGDAVDNLSLLHQAQHSFRNTAGCRLNKVDRVGVGAVKFD
jgi:hypothetical protein